MRDPRLGTFGAVALVLSLVARWSLLTTAAPLAVVAAAMASRAAMAPVMRALPPARADGLGRSAGRPSARGVAAACALGALPLAPMGAQGAAAAGTAALAAWGVARVARAKIGGQTGDICGASQQVAEIAVLATLAAR